MESNKKNKSKLIWVYQVFPTDWRLLFRMVALFTSWYLNKSIVWGVIHYFFGWLYITYAIFSGVFSDGGLGNIIKHYIG